MYACSPGMAVLEEASNRGQEGALSRATPIAQFPSEGSAVYQPLPSFRHSQAVAGAAAEVRGGCVYSKGSLAL